MCTSYCPDGLATLQRTITSCTTLIESFRLTLQSHRELHSSIQDPPNPLAVLSDAFQVLSAQITKLSLLVLNKPFTPSAITLILRSLSNSCLPSMMSALELFRADQYTELLHNHVQSSLSITFTELLNLLASIPQDEHGIEIVRRDVLASTGVLWAECQKMVDLGVNGLVGLDRQKVEENHGLLKDAIEEIEEWDPDEAELDSDTGSVSEIEDTLEPATTSDDDVLSRSLENPKMGMDACHKHILTHLRLIRVLYPALQKRRITTFPNISSASTPKTMPTVDQIEELDMLVTCTRQWTDCADEVAGLLYDRNEVLVEVKLNRLRDHAGSCVKEFRRGWNDMEDEFTGWSEKWLARLKEVSEEVGE